jgi:7-cyano-7-deazaguanine synthase
MTEVLLLASGGLDSTTLAYWLVAKGTVVRPLFFDYGQHCMEKEWRTLQQVLPKAVLLPERADISGLFRGSRSKMIVEPDLWSERVESNELYLPYRTLLFIAAAAARAQTLGLTDVFSGFINSNHAKELDCTAAYLNGLDALATGVGPVRLQLPFRDHSKKQVAEIAAELGVPIGCTFSCQVFSDVPCGVCPNCVERLTALADGGSAT